MNYALEYIHAPYVTPNGKTACCIVRITLNDSRFDASLIVERALEKIKYILSKHLSDCFPMDKKKHQEPETSIEEVEEMSLLHVSHHGYTMDFRPFAWIISETDHAFNVEEVDFRESFLCVLKPTFQCS